jgi:hypothetical protein
MANTYVKIASVAVGSGGAATIDFTSIPATYTDLKVVYSIRDTAAGVNGGNLKVTYNGSTTTYTNKLLYGSGAAAGSTNSGTTFADAGIGTSMPSAGNTASVFSNCEVYIPNYLSSNYKSASIDSVGENNTSTAYSGLDAALWSTTSAITQITATAGTLFTQYSTATLYGISKS